MLRSRGGEVAAAGDGAMTDEAESVEEVLAFWFGPEAEGRWFAKDEAFDARLGRRLGGLASAAAGGRLDGWAGTARGALALVILLDQLPRNLHRGRPDAFAQDPKARAVASRAVDQGLDRSLTPRERLFLYLPFEHGEDLADQDRAVALIGALGDAEQTDYAVRHRAVVRRFGRFPHRNRVLGRESTPEEVAFLTEPGSSF